MKKLLSILVFIFSLFLTPFTGSASCTPPSQYPGQCISQSDLTSKNTACQKSGNNNSLACTEAKACEASLSIYLSDSATYFNCKADEEKLEQQAAADKAAQDEALRIQNEQNQFIQAELTSCKNKLVANFEVVDHLCKCKLGYSTLNNVCTDVNQMCLTWYGEGGYSTSKTDATCACKEGYMMNGKSCVLKPVQTIIPTSITTTPTPPTTPLIPTPVKKDIPKSKPTIIPPTASITPIVASTSVSTSSVVKETPIIKDSIVEPIKKVEIPKESFVKRIWKALFSWW